MVLNQKQYVITSKIPFPYGYLLSQTLGNQQFISGHIPDSLNLQKIANDSAINLFGIKTYPYIILKINYITCCN